MTVEICVPQVGESITEVQIGEWLKSEGDRVERDEVIVTIETEKATVEVAAPAPGIVGKVLKVEGDIAEVGEVIGHLEEGAPSAETAPTDTAADPGADSGDDEAPVPESGAAELRVTPTARRVLEEHGVALEEVAHRAVGGRLQKQDVIDFLETRDAAGASKNTVAPPRAPQSESSAGDRETETVRMSPMRRRIAERLVQAQLDAALLTTVNEIDMSAVMALRAAHKESFQGKYGVKLGFMSFFIKATIDALRGTPEINAQIRGDHIVYHNYYDIGVAVGSGKGLVVPVLRNAERMSFAEVEIAIRDFATRAQKNALTLDELQGGTFTISNGGVYGSLLSTPIVNPPQSGILGLHRIDERPIALDGEVVIRPMMYVALTYDHRIVDGREAVTFLKRIKEAMEEPARMLLEV
jgi:2-oxoglutarate dehydrogenase E2 component (dihydrolipoamide succinyltransferase)